MGSIPDRSSPRRVIARFACADYAVCERSDLAAKPAVHWAAAATNPTLK
jgi:hypothetical protein